MYTFHADDKITVVASIISCSPNNFGRHLHSLMTVSSLYPCGKPKIISKFGEKHLNTEQQTFSTKNDVFLTY